MDWYYYSVRGIEITLTVAGIVYFLATRRRSLRATRLGVIGLAAVLAGQVVTVIFFDLWRALQVHLGLGDRSSLRLVQTLMNLLTVLGVGLVVVAVASDRRPVRTSEV